MTQAQHPIQIRPAVDSDYMAFARLFPELKTGDQPPGMAAWTHEMVPSTLMIESGNQVVGYAFFQVLETAGYVRHLVVDSSWRGLGHGRAAMRHVSNIMRAAGCTTWCLNVEPANDPAIHLYRSLGMRERWDSTALGIKWTLVDRLPAHGAPLRARPMQAREDTLVERAFGLPAGQLRDARRLGTRHLIRLVREQQPDDPRVGIAVFDPSFPGAFPFRVAEPDMARALLEGIRPSAHPDFDYVRVVVEDDASLTDLLIHEGATVFLHVTHMEGELSGVV